MVEWRGVGRGFVYLTRQGGFEGRSRGYQPGVMSSASRGATESEKNNAKAPAFCKMLESGQNSEDMREIQGKRKNQKGRKKVGKRHKS